ncbi:40S ribosomal protein [Vigna angularis]|uniref:40S ribosomal protein n=1 Tax=Phaseolus angularis TaxID=3914 RepID=A0A8T0KT73_PHAAN|nr:40S ribosomal protein [Vigna angularis]
MGRVRTKTVKKSSRQVIERYYSRMTLDFHTNKKVLEESQLHTNDLVRNSTRTRFNVCAAIVVNLHRPSHPPSGRRLRHNVALVGVIQSWSPTPPTSGRPPHDPGHRNAPSSSPS